MASPTEQSERRIQSHDVPLTHGPGPLPVPSLLSLPCRGPITDMSALLEEMICQRQAQDYQHIVSDLVPAAKPGTAVFYFSLRNQVHTITWDKRSNSIDVRRHIHKRVIQDRRRLVKFPYSYFLWSAHTSSFVNVQRDMEPNRDDPPWSYADNVLCDAHFYADDLSEGLKYRRIQSVTACLPTRTQPASGRSRSLLAHCMAR